LHGSGAGHETLAKYVLGRNAAMIVDDDLHDLSLQGPWRSISRETRFQAFAISNIFIICRRRCSAVP